MYRVLAIVGAGLLVGACSSTGGSLFGPSKDTVRFESEPPGAEAKVSTGEACKTPCALAMPTDKGFSVTFTLLGYQTVTQEVQLAESSQFRPNPVNATLAAVPPPKKKIYRKKPTARPAPRPKPVAAAPRQAPSQQAAPAAAPPPMTPAQQPQVTSPWPSAPPPPAPQR
jgi:hypothetical protein